jgi:hypothetical protein
MRILLPTLLGACALASAGAAIAQSTTPSAPDWAAKHAQMQQNLFNKIDTNHDGVISSAEYQAWVDARFAKLDPSGKGSVTAADIAASPATQAMVQKHAEGFVKRYDTSGTGSVTKAEFETKEMARFNNVSGSAGTLTTPAQLAAVVRPAHGAWHRGAAQSSSTTTTSGN